ncbi:MAG: site-2 protease family protein [Pirellulaceae bacterium]
MDERFDWSASIGRWFGVSLRVHLFLVLILLFAFAVEWQNRTHLPSVTGTGLVFGFVLLVSVLLHELSQIFTLKNLGGSVESITLFPWGGQSSMTASREPGVRFAIYAAGPFANLLLFLISAAVLLQAGHKEFAELINPFNPPEFYTDTWKVSFVSLMAWVNFQLFWVNLIPCFPLDGAEMTRSIFYMADGEYNDGKVEATLMAVGQLTGFIAFAFAWLLRNYDHGPVQPAWAILLLGGVALLFCARYDFRNQMRRILEAEEWYDDDEPELESEFSYTEEGLNFLAEEGYSQWLVEKQLEREQSRHEIAEETERHEEEQLDEILSKLHKNGFENLTDIEKEILHRVSARIRHRRQFGNVD